MAQKRFSAKDVEKLRSEGVITAEEIPVFIDELAFAIKPTGEKRFLQIENLILEVNRRILKD